MWDWLNNDNMIQSPGLIDIPMCGMDEVMDNWRLTKNDYYSWPCNKTGVPSFSPQRMAGRRDTRLRASVLDHFGDPNSRKVSDRAVDLGSPWAEASLG